MTKAESFLKKARLKLSGIKYRFFGLCLYPLRIRFFGDNITKCEGFVRYENLENKRYENCIYINEDFIDNINGYKTPNFIDIMLHEFNHILRRHDIRRGNRNPQIWNVACDHIIDLAISKLNLSKPAVRWNIIEKIKDDPKLQTEEDVYTWLEKNAKKVTIKCNGDGSITVTEDNGNSFTFHPDLQQDGNQTLTPEQRQAVENYISQVRAIYNLEKDRGTIGSDVSEMLEKLLEVKVPWDEILEHAIKKNAFQKASRRNWKSPNKLLYAGSKIYLPGRVRVDDNTGIGTLLVHIDTSGSIGKKEIAKAGWIIQKSMQYFSKIHLITADVLIHQKVEFTKNNSDEITRFFVQEGVKGRGGTSHAHVFEFWDDYIAKYPDDVSLMISITDLWSDIDNVIGKFEAIKSVPLILLTDSNEAKINKHHNVETIVMEDV